MDAFQMYIVEFHMKDKNKNGECAWIRLKFSNGKIFMHSESYKNYKFAFKKAKHLSEFLQAKFIKIDHRKKKK